MALPILYSFRRCPYAMRTRLAVVASNRQCELREVVLRDKPGALLRASPKATVPVLVDTDGVVIDESLDIMRWALQHNDPFNWLAPEGGSLADALALIAQNDGPFKQNLDRYKYPVRYGLTNGSAARDAAGPWLDHLNERIAASGFLLGSRASLADMAIAPFVRQFAMTDAQWFGGQPWAALQAWLQAFLDSHLFSQVMPKFKPWQEGTVGVRFPVSA
jgi:glutathione S-transferase